ncbi:hypothetical protein ISN44_As01g044800 [Arabidopsis suecica]|uniref:Uncharacterized protein n=1 Tax=Arabidopsis suecica TaxID=45249 RepID=A0A8T2HBX7_ARASU|nr:hypothetical protein ISN44_As01g044800 [Arabidopsis suecica]
MGLREGKSGHLPAIQSVERLNGRKIVLWEKKNIKVGSLGEGRGMYTRLDFMGKTTVAKEDRSNIAHQTVVVVLYERHKGDTNEPQHLWYEKRERQAWFVVSRVQSSVPRSGKFSERGELNMSLT